MCRFCLCECMSVEHRAGLHASASQPTQLLPSLACKSMRCLLSAAIAAVAPALHSLQEAELQLTQHHVPPAT